MSIPCHVERTVAAAIPVLVALVVFSALQVARAVRPGYAERVPLFRIGLVRR